MLVIGTIRPSSAVARLTHPLCLSSRNNNPNHGQLSSSTVFQQCRGARNKRATSLYSDPLKRDEILLRRLQLQLDEVKAKIKREEDEAAQMMKRYQNHGLNPDEPPSHNLYFWEKVLSKEDRKELAMNGIHSMEQLRAVHEEAETLMKKPPFPKLEALPARLKYGHQMHENMPSKMLEAGRRKGSSWFGGLF
ncbi:hypothetical protein BDN72DRAFT_831609 [Pluteus cervinus]|uniref:Uncharacterized protein n=1 Tax=Pluteus cervinus TaxID=181527 RepID=A0ACD3BE54_9AGAR|nr:hypothetical protein BDN72DRAFT_831609 [Pluteus cervinus]